MNATISSANSARRTLLRRAWLVMLLLGSHAMLYLAARGAGADGPGEGDPAKAMLPAKSSARDGGITSRKFLRGMLAEYESPSSGLARQDFEDARLELFREWLRRDPGSALDTLYAPQNRERYRKLAAGLYDDIVAELARCGPKAADWIATRRFGSATDTIASRWVEAMLGSKQEREVLAALQVLPTRVASQAFVDTAAQADAGVLAELRSRLGSFAETDISNPREAYAYRKALLAGDDPHALLEGEEDEELRHDLVTRWTLRAVAQRPDMAAVDLLENLPEEYRRQALCDLFGEGRQGGLQGTAALLQELDSRGLTTDLAIDPEIMEAASRYQARAHSKGDYAGFLRDLSLVRRDSLRHALLRKITADSPAILLEELSGLRRGADLDVLLSRPAADPGTDPVMREAFLAAMSDRALASRIRSELAEELGGGG